MQGGVGGVGGAPPAMNLLWGGPACKRLRTPVLEYFKSIFAYISTNIFPTSPCNFSNLHEIN